MEKVPFMDLWALNSSVSSQVFEEMQKLVKESDFIGGKRVEAFENEFARFTEASHVVGVSNGSSAVSLALRASGVGPGDEVITVPNTFIATIEAIHQIGATPVLVDVDPRTALMDVSLLEGAITEKTKAILPVHLYGSPVNMDAVMAVAKKHGLVVIQDAAQAHGARWNSLPLSAYGESQTYSFYPAKNLGAWGDAGAVVTQKKEIAESISAYRNHGRKSGEKYRHETDGFNERMDPIQATVLKAKLAFLAKQNESRNQIAKAYRNGLEGVGDIRFFTPESQATSVYHLFVIQTSKRDGLHQYLKKENVATGIHYPIPLHQQPVFSGLDFTQKRLPVAEKQASEILSLPLFPDMTQAQIEFVIHAVRSFF